MKERIIIGDYYRLADTPTYGWARVLEIIEPHKGINTHGYLIAKCEWTMDKSSLFGLIKYFKVRDIVLESHQV